MRLIDENGGQVGIVSIEEARERATAAGMDLVEVAPEARPPVCRLMDYGSSNTRRRGRPERRRRSSITYS